MKPNEAERYLVFEVVEDSGGEVVWKLLGDVPDDSPSQAARQVIDQDEGVSLGDYQLRVVQFEDVSFFNAVISRVISRNVDVR